MFFLNTGLNKPTEGLPEGVGGQEPQVPAGPAGAEGGPRARAVRHPDQAEAVRGDGLQQRGGLQQAGAGRCGGQGNMYCLVLMFQDWKESHAAYKVLEAKRVNQSKMLIKSISKSQFGLGKQ